MYRVVGIMLPEDIFIHFFTLAQIHDINVRDRLPPKREEETYKRERLMFNNRDHVRNIDTTSQY